MCIEDGEEPKMCLMICYFEEPECAEGAVCLFLSANVTSANRANQEPSKTGVRTLIKMIYLSLLN